MSITHSCTKHSRARSQLSRFRPANSITRGGNQPVGHPHLDAKESLESCEKILIKTFKVFSKAQNVCKSWHVASASGGSLSRLSKKSSPSNRFANLFHAEWNARRWMHQQKPFPSLSACSSLPSLFNGAVSAPSAAHNSFCSRTILRSVHHNSSDKDFLLLTRQTKIFPFLIVVVAPSAQINDFFSFRCHMCER